MTTKRIISACLVPFAAAFWRFAQVVEWCETRSKRMKPGHHHILAAALALFASVLLFLAGCASPPSPAVKQMTTEERDARLYHWPQPEPPIMEGLAGRVTRVPIKSIAPPAAQITQTFLFDYPVQITNGFARYVVFVAYPDGRKLASVPIPEPTGRRAIIGRQTNSLGQSWWVPVGWTNITQTVPVAFQNTSTLHQLAGWRVGWSNEP